MSLFSVTVAVKRECGARREFQGIEDCFYKEGAIEAVREPSKAPSCHSEPFDSLRVNSAKNLINLDTYAFEILRLTPQNDIVGQPR